MTLLHRLRENPLILTLGVAIGLLSSLNSIGLMQSAQEWLSFKMINAEIETTRAAARMMPCSTIGIAYQPVVASVLAWNVRIAHEREARLHWWSWLMSPWWWLNVQPITMPCTWDRK